MSEEKDFGPIYKQVLGCCLPYNFDVPWQALEVPGDVQRLPSSPDNMIDKLRQQFSDAQLQEAGVLNMDESMAIQPDPIICAQGELVIALRKTPESDPFELIVGERLLSGRMLPICASLRDGRINKMIQSTKGEFLCVATSAADLAVLMALKIRATLITGLVELGGDDLQQVQEDFQFCPPKPETQDRYIIFHEDAEDEKKVRPPDLILVGWRVAEMSAEEPETFSPIASHLAKVEKYLNIPLDRFYKWCPPESARLQFEFCIKHAGRPMARRAILESIDSSSEQLIVRRRADNSPNTLEEAMEKFQQLRSRSRRDPEDERRAWEDIIRLIRRDAIAPLLAAADESVDPIEREIWNLAAMTGQVLHSQFIRLLLASDMQTKNSNSARLIAFPDKEFRQVMLLVTQQQKLLKSIADYQKNPFCRWK